MEPVESVASWRRANLRAGERVSRGYRSTKQWVEEVSQQSQQSRGIVVGNKGAEQQQQCERARRMSSPAPKVSEIRSRRDGSRGVHFKQEENEQNCKLASKVAYRPSLSPANVRKESFPDTQAAALAPISLNVAAAGGRLVSSSAIPAAAKLHSNFDHEALPGRVKESETGHFAVISLDGKVQAVQQRTNEEGKQVVWCNAAFETDDDSRTSAQGFSASSSKFHVGGDSSRKMKTQEQTTTSALPYPNVHSCAVFSSSVIGPASVIPRSPSQDTFVGFDSPGVDSEVAASSPVKSPHHQDDVPHIPGLEAEPPAGDSFSPLESERLSQTSQVGLDLSKTRRTPTPTPLPWFTSGTGEQVTSIDQQKAPKQYPEVAQSKFESPGRRNLKKSVPLVRSGTPGRGPVTYTSNNLDRRHSKTSAPNASVWCGKVDHRGLLSTRSTVKQSRPDDQPANVEADLEADIEKEIEQEIANEISHLSQRLAALQAKQETRRVGEKPTKSGVTSCPQTPVRRAPSPAGSDSANKRRGRVVASKFLQDNRVKHGSEICANRSGTNSVGFSDPPPFTLSKPNPPRRSLGTPARLLTKAKLSSPGKRQSLSSPCPVQTPDSEAPSRGSGAPKATTLRRNLHEESERKEWNQLDQKKKDAPSGSTVSAPVVVLQSTFYPEFERKLDWVKSLRTDPLPVPHYCPTASIQGQALDENFLKQNSERKDVHAWLRENMVEAQCDEVPSLTHHRGSGNNEVAKAESGDNDVKKVRKMEHLTPRRSRGGTGSTTPLRNPTPTRTTLSSCNSRTVPSRYGTPGRTTPKMTTTGGSDSKPWCDQGSTPRRKWKTESGPASRKVSVSPGIRRGYPVASGVKTTPGGSSIRKSRGGEEQLCNGEGPKVERKITAVPAEYETFVEKGVQMEKPIEQAADVSGKMRRNQEQEVGSKNKSFRVSADIAEPARKIFIRCSDLIKDKHHLLMKGKQRQMTGQSVLPSNCQDSDDSVFARSNTRTESSEIDGKSEASIVEEISCGSVVRDSSQPLGKRGVQFVTTRNENSLRPRRTWTPTPTPPEYNTGHDCESGNPGVSSYRPEDYTLEMMLEYVDTLKSERDGLPRIKASKTEAVVIDNFSPRDSGCIKRKREGERRAQFFKASRDVNKEAHMPIPLVEASTLDNDGLSPDEIEGLDLESFWCLVGDPERPIII